MACLKSVPQCAQCAAEETYEESQGHCCGSSTPQWPTWCEVIGESRRDNPEFHRLTHMPVICQECATVLDDHQGAVRYAERLCPMGRCTQVVCDECGEVESSFGDVYCPSCGSSRHAPRLRRMRRQYRLRRRGRW